MKINSLSLNFRNAVKAYDEAKQKFNRLVVARIASAPDSTFEMVGRAACELALCEMEMKDAQAELLASNSAK